MRLNRLVVIIFIFVLFSVVSVTASTCGNVGIDTTLDSDVVADVNTVCFTFTASDVVLDCDGHSITYSGSGTGIWTNSRSYVTVKNCVLIQDGSNGNPGFAIQGWYSGNSTYWNNIIYSNADDAAISIFQADGVNISWNKVIQNGTYLLNGSAIDIQDSNNVSVDVNIINVTAASGAAGISILGGDNGYRNIVVRENMINTTSSGTWGIYINGYASTNDVPLDVGSGYKIEKNRIYTKGEGGFGNSHVEALVIYDVHGIQVRHNEIYGLGNSNEVLIMDGVNNSIFDNNTISAVSTFEELATLQIFGISHNNVFVNNNITALQGMWEIKDNSRDYYNYLIYNNSYGQVAWMNNGSSNSFLRELNISVNGSLSLGETILIGDDFIAVNASAFTPVLMVNRSVNVTLKGLSGDTLDSITVDHAFRTIVGDIVGAVCSEPFCTGSTFSGGVLTFVLQGFVSLTSSTSQSGGEAVPEFSDYAMMFILVIGISGFFVMKRREDA